MTRTMHYFLPYVYDSLSYVIVVSDHVIINQIIVIIISWNTKNLKKYFQKSRRGHACSALCMALSRATRIENARKPVKTRSTVGYTLWLFNSIIHDFRCSHPPNRLTIII